MQTQKINNLNKIEIDKAYALDMSSESYPSVIGRDNEIQRMIEILCRKNKANPILVGEAGVGKTALVHGLVNLIKEGNVPYNLINKKVYSLDLSLLAKDITAVKYVIDQVTSSGDILFIDEIHNIVGAGKSFGSLDVANIMKPLLTSGNLMCIGATTPEEYMKYFEKDSALERRFSKVSVDEPDFDSCLKILKSSVSSFEKHHSVRVEEKALEACIKLSQRYITDKQLPDKAFDVLDEACSKKSLEISKYKNIEKEIERYESEFNWEKVSELKYSNTQNLKEDYDLVTSDDVAKIISLKTSIPTNKLNGSDKEKLLNLESYLKEKVIGQDEVLTCLSNQIKTTRTGLRDSVTSFLFLGSTGVGKTETAKAISEALFDNDTSLIRFDMSEFQEKHSISKLIGAPAGYVGYEEGGRLTEAVKQKPYSVVLFDEVEKAHPSIYDTLLQVLDEGILTDSLGRTVNFKNTIIIMTSNLKREDLNGFFRVEFLNRINEITVFNNLTKENVEKITLQKLVSLSNKIKKDNEILVDFSKSLLAKIVELAYKPECGAREINRVIHRLIQVPLSEKILKGELEKDRIFVLN
jgi:ATP-dependent Clp protease ATP-binding subunit ClpC